VLVVCNFTAVLRTGYRIGVPVAGSWSMLLNGDDHRFGGSGTGNERVETEDVAAHGHEVSLAIDIPPLAACFLAPA
jgi:1,4-alpha-glucan branching enzyme